MRGETTSLWNIVFVPRNTTRTIDLIQLRFGNTYLSILGVDSTVVAVSKNFENLSMASIGKVIRCPTMALPLYDPAPVVNEIKQPKGLADDKASCSRRESGGRCISIFLSDICMLSITIRSACQKSLLFAREYFGIASPSMAMWQVSHIHTHVCPSELC
jgi:hypothetical protein